MKHINIIIPSILLTTSLTATAAYSQSVSPRPTLLPTSSPIPNSNQIKPNNWEINVKEILETPNLADCKFWMMLGVILAAGSLGGLVYELLNLQGNIELPHKPTDDDLAVKFAYAHSTNVIDLGVVARLLIGALAAPPAIAIVRPETAFILLATSAVAGSAGTLIFRALQDRLLVAVLQTGINEVSARSIKPQQPIDEAIKDFDKLVQEVRKHSESPRGLTELKFTRDATLDPSDFEEVSKHLNQIQGVNPKVDEAIEIFKELVEEVRKHSESPSGTTKLKITKGTVLPFEHLQKIKTLLWQAKKDTETTTSANDSTAELASKPMPPAEGSTSSHN
ncbi:hypothetical protein NDI49_06370 [Trichocoleus sp. ST-U3]|uniref:hypothetical protein n=2 Tax=Cyanobacteriota TaxID=1117 RepID=UPI00168966AB|nr:hypothetical protein [Coleofasciculus sp. FACHB-542]MBD2086347.1 hypothetical protein [Coleofasciculus sp. FACHB-542]